jgi:hypothetical protein
LTPTPSGTSAARGRPSTRTIPAGTAASAAARERDRRAAFERRTARLVEAQARQVRGVQERARRAGLATWRALCAYVALCVCTEGAQTSWNAPGSSARASGTQVGRRVDPARSAASLASSMRPLGVPQPSKSAARASPARRAARARARPR